MHLARMTFHRGSGALSGSIGGKHLHIVTRPAHGSAALPAGEYAIHPPVIDPIYGAVALVVPTAGPSNPAGDTVSYIKNAPANKWSAPANKYSAPVNKLSAPTNKWSAPANKYSAPTDKWASPMPAGESGLNETVFVLSQKAIPGRNSIIVSSGFADLMDALHAAGGATITVS